MVKRISSISPDGGSAVRYLPMLSATRAVCSLSRFSRTRSTMFSMSVTVNPELTEMPAPLRRTTVGRAAVVSPWIERRSWAISGNSWCASGVSIAVNASSSSLDTSFETENGIPLLRIMARARCTMELSTVRLVALIFMIFLRRFQSPTERDADFSRLFKKKSCFPFQESRFLSSADSTVLSVATETARMKTSTKQNRTHTPAAALALLVSAFAATEIFTPFQGVAADVCVHLEK